MAPFGPVSPSQRHSLTRPCAVCGGHADMPRNQGVRDYGFDSVDGSRCICTRSEYAGRLGEGAVGWVHRLDGPCRCGLPHGEPMPVLAASNANRSQDRQRTQDYARQLWLRARAIAGTPGETYLRRRGITIPLPPTLRYIDRTPAPDGLPWPALIAAVGDPEGHFLAIHRTFLLRDGVKAPTDTQKAMLGPVGGGAVWLARPGPVLAVAEGIETALSVLQATGVPTWAALSTSGIKALVLPSAVREVYVAADNDEPGQSAADYAARRWSAEGRRVRIALPCGVKDFNDLLRGAA